MQDLTGQKFGRLTIAENIGKSISGHCFLWLCMCDCGQEIIVRSGNLKSGHTKSCGCLRQELLTKHGYTKGGQYISIYRTWCHMIERCTKPNHKEYKNYGGRGITVCERWRKFENFLEDMNERPTKDHSIDRIDNNEGYYKENCRWATRREQASNTRKNHLVTYKGKTQHLAAWGREFDICPRVLRNRIKKGWSMNKALITPIRKRRK